jgi:hypothetical protein
MVNFKIYGERDGEVKGYLGSNNGQWRCLCCGEALTMDEVAFMLEELSANDDDNEGKEAA